MNRKTHKSSDGYIIELMDNFTDEVHDAFSYTAEGFNLDIQKAKALMTLHENGQLRQVEVSQRVNMAQYATSRMMDFLEKRELLQRVKDPASRRSHLISLTEKGQSLAHQLFEVKADINQQALTQLSLSEKKELIDLLLKAIEKNKIS